MFNWTAASVLAAIDAGIAEVIALHNANYTLAHIKGIKAGASAYAYAMHQTVADLMLTEALGLVTAWASDTAWTAKPKAKAVRAIDPMLTYSFSA